MVSLTNREWCTYRLSCTLFIFALAFSITSQKSVENNVAGTANCSSTLDSNLDFVALDSALEPNETFVYVYDPPRTNDVDLYLDIVPTRQKATVTQSLNDFINVLNSAAKLAGVADAVEKFLSGIELFKGIFELFFGLLPHNSEYEMILQSFNTVYEKLDALTYKMEQIEKKIEIAIEWRSYKDERHKVLAVSESFDSMARHPKDSSFEREFIASCRANRMKDRLNYMEIEMNRTHADSMIYKLGSEFHMDFFLASSTDVLTTATKAAFLLGACLRKEQQEYNNLSDVLIKDEENISTAKILSIIRSIRDGAAIIKRDYFAFLKREIDARTNAAGGKDNEQFARELYDHISAKYNWRTWFVSSYNGNTRGFKEHAIFWGGHAYWERYNNRHVMIATPQDSTKSLNRDLIKQKFDYCVRQHVCAVTNLDECLLLANELDQCLKTSTLFKGQCIQVLTEK